MSIQAGQPESAPSIPRFENTQVEILTLARNTDWLEQVVPPVVVVDEGYVDELNRCVAISSSMGLAQMEWLRMRQDRSSMIALQTPQDVMLRATRHCYDLLAPTEDAPLAHVYRKSFRPLRIIETSRCLQVYLGPMMEGVVREVSGLYGMGSARLKARLAAFEEAGVTPGILLQQAPELVLSRRLVSRLGAAARQAEEDFWAAQEREPEGTPPPHSKPADQLPEEVRQRYDAVAAGADIELGALTVGVPQLAALGGLALEDLLRRIDAAMKRQASARNPDGLRVRDIVRLIEEVEIQADKNPHF